MFMWFSLLISVFFVNTRWALFLYILIAANISAIESIMTFKCAASITCFIALGYNFIERIGTMLYDTLWTVPSTVGGERVDRLDPWHGHALTFSPLAWTQYRFGMEILENLAAYHVRVFL
ncbi:hypothetical protein ACJX0J_040956, partial [Zea mays]